MRRLSTARAFAYVATGPGYVSEAIHSARSLRQHHPQGVIALITDCPPQDQSPFNLIQDPRRKVERGPIDKLQAYDLPFEEIVFLDSDTLVLGDLEPIFDLLSTHDMAALLDVNRGWNYDLPGLPVTFSEMNTGVLAFRKSEKVEKFFQDWHSNFEELKPILAGQGQPPMSDQPSFRYTLFRSNIRMATLPSEFHFLADFPNATMWRVSLVHGRSDLSRAGALLNAKPGLRAYLPYGGCLARFQGRKSLLMGTVRFLLRLSLFLIRPVRDPSSQGPSQWHKTGL